ncbi:MAG: alpha/beta hydrolase [Pseudomonadota bacterium]
MANPTDYDNADFIPGGPGYFARWQADADAFRAAREGDRLDLPYGDHPREAFDLFLPASAPEGLFVFIHGGFWRLGHRDGWSQFAAGALARHWAVALPSYPLCPEVRIADITRSIARALPAMAAEVAGPIIVTGHSAGGHLSLRMLDPAVGLPSAVTERVAAVLSISPLSDLAPLQEMPMNADLRIDATEAAAESPVHQPEPAVPVLIEVGANERPAFIDQARWMAGAWPRANLTIVDGTHHFDVIDALRYPDSAMMQRLFARLEA